MTGVETPLNVRLIRKQYGVVKRRLGNAERMLWNPLGRSRVRSSLLGFKGVLLIDYLSRRTTINAIVRSWGNSEGDPKQKNGKGDKNSAFIPYDNAWSYVTRQNQDLIEECVWKFTTNSLVLTLTDLQCFPHLNEHLGERKMLTKRGRYKRKSWKMARQFICRVKWRWIENLLLYGTNCIQI